MKTRGLAHRHAPSASDSLSLQGTSGERGNRSASSPQPSPPFRMEERVAAGRERRLLGNRVGVNARMRRRLRHEDFFDDLPHGRGPSSDPLSARHERGEGKPERLLSPTLSSIPNGGEGGRRPAEEAARQSRRRKCADAPPASARGFLRWSCSCARIMAFVVLERPFRALSYPGRCPEFLRHAPLGLDLSATGGPASVQGDALKTTPPNKF